MHLSVECYAGHRGEETPRQIRFGDRVVEVREVVDRWLAPEHRYFKVTGDDDAPRRALRPLGADDVRARLSTRCATACIGARAGPGRRTQEP
jgi:hypothetical protein